MSQATNDEPAAGPSPLADDEVARACDLLEHYHQHHTSDKCTRFRGKGTKDADIYVVTDPTWKRRLREVTRPIFPEPKEPKATK